MKNAKTSLGVITTTAYDEGDWKGLHVYLDGHLVCAIDVSEPDSKNESKARVIAYTMKPTEDDDSPIAIIPIN